MYRCPHSRIDNQPIHAIVFAYHHLCRAIVSSVVPVVLPDVAASIHLCQRCYVNRECTMYARAAQATVTNASGTLSNHKDLLDLYTGHLDSTDLEYFLKWDQLIDLELSSVSTSLAESWLIPAHKKETETGKCMSGMILSSKLSRRPVETDKNFALIVFEKDDQAEVKGSLNSLGFEKGCYVIVSTDCSLANGSINGNRRQMHILRGSLESVSPNSVSIRGAADDLLRIEKVMNAWTGTEKLLFRLDIEDLPIGIGTLR
jgi:hypothetical protein